MFTYPKEDQAGGVWCGKSIDVSVRGTVNLPLTYQASLADVLSRSCSVGHNLDIYGSNRREFEQYKPSDEISVLIQAITRMHVWLCR
jgi:hypothetical protein